MICAVLTALPIFVYAGDDDDPPPPPPPTCCDSGYEAQGTYKPPKCGAKDDEHPLIGEMGDVYILANPIGVGADISGNGMAMEFTTGTTHRFYAVGGGDSDVCVQTDPPEGQCPDYKGCPNVSNKYVWSGAPGAPDPNNPSEFIFEPPAPGIYDVTLTSVEDGACNVGGESETTNTRIVVYEIRGIYPNPGGNTIVPRGESMDFYVELEHCSPIPDYPKWSSTATTATATGLSWGGEHAIGYTMNVDVQASVTLPLNTVLVGKSLSKDIVTTKGRTFNCTAVNFPQRYTVPDDYEGDPDLVGNCKSSGECWDYPHPGTQTGFNTMATSMSEQISIKDIGSGPNTGIAYIEDMDSVQFNIDTNTSTNFRDPSTQWYQNHATPAGWIAILHAETQAHEEHHFDNVREAEEYMNGQPGHPQDMYDTCEDITGSVNNHDAIRSLVQGVLAYWIEDIYDRSNEYDDRDVMHEYDNPDSDYYEFYCDPHEHCCDPTTACNCGTP